MMLIVSIFLLQSRTYVQLRVFLFFYNIANINMWIKIHLHYTMSAA